MFSPKSFIVLALTFGTLIHFSEFLYMIVGQLHSFAFGYPVFPALLLKRHCNEFCSFILSFDIRKLILFQECFGSSRSLEMPYEF